MIRCYYINHRGLNFNQDNKVQNKNLSKDDFSYIKNVKSRWRDMDAIGHINNAIYLTYFETVRVDYLHELGFELLKRGNDVGVILASMKIDYLIQSLHPNTFSIGCRITRLGTKSFDLYSAIFDVKNINPVVVGVFTLVMFNYKTQKTIDLTDNIKNSYNPF